MTSASFRTGPPGCPGLRYLASLVLIGAFASCDRSPTIPETEPALTTSPASQWAGGAIRITLADRDPESIGAVIAGTDSLAFQPDGASALTAYLPADANGTREIWLEMPGERLRAGVVDVHGLEGTEVMMPRLVRGLRDWEGGPAGAAVLGPTPGGLAILRPAARSASTFEGIHAASWLYSPGQSADPLDVFTRVEEQNSVTQWRLTTTVPPTPLDTIPLIASWSIARGAPDIWFVAYHHFLQALRGPAADGSFEKLLDIQAEGTLGWDFLPELDLVAPAGSSYRDGLPVFHASSGEIAFRVEDVFQSDALVALRERGEFAVAGRGRSGNALTIFDGMTGEILAQSPIEGDAASLEFDPDRGVFFVLHAFTWRGGFVGVYDAATLALVGRMSVPEVVFWDAELALDDAALFAVFGDSRPIDEDAVGTVVYRYRLP